MRQITVYNKESQYIVNFACQLLKPVVKGGQLLKYSFFNPQAPVTQKTADEVVFRRFQGERVEFFKSDLTDPSQVFDAHLLENTDLSPSRFHFSVSFITRSCFESDGFIAYSNE